MDLYDVVQCPVDFDSTAGKIRIHDGWAAGGAWYLVEFLDPSKRGLFGHRLWMNGMDERHLVYGTDECDDGFVFNYPSGRVQGDAETLVDGGEYRPVLEGFTVRIDA